MKKKGFFITGTDTDIGKTYVSRLLADTFAESLSVSYMKPVQTGCTRESDGIVHAPDFDAVMSGKASRVCDYEQHVPYRYEPACSPHLGAILAHEVISLEHIQSCYRAIADKVALTLIEGAGGILAPLGETTFFLDLIVHLQLPVILVTTPQVGTLNHTFLTLRVLHESGIAVAGIVLNNSKNHPDNFMYQENRRMIADHTHPVPFLELPYQTTEITLLKDFCHAVLTRP